MILRISNHAPYFPANEAPPPQVKNSIVPETEKAEEIQGPILEGSAAPLRDDLWGFKAFWDFIKKQYPSVSQFYQALKDRHEDIRFSIEVFRPQIEVLKSVDSAYYLIESLASSVSSNGNYQIDPNQLELIEAGVSGSYFLLDAEGKTRFIVKPTDEDTCCLNNPKGYNSPFVWSLFRRYMPLYFSAFREVAAYEVAKSIGLGRIVPKTVLAILESTRFSYMSDRIAPEERERYLKECGPDLREKLCSLQEFIPNAKSLFEVLQDFQQAGMTNKEIEKRFDQKDFEDANILIWTTYDTDAHAGNILLYEKEIDSTGNQIFGIKKIDNGLAFPDKNRHFYNYLKSLPNANRPLSEEGRTKIKNLNLSNLTLQLKAFGLGSSIPALKQRIAFLKELIETPDISIKEINQALAKLGEKK